MKPNSVLGVFAKEPRPGHVKTRLAQATSPEWAAEFARACLQDTLDLVGAFPARRVVAFAPATADAYFARLGERRFELTPQCEGDLGQRMVDFFQGQFGTGAERVVLLGSDSPTLPINHVHQAFAALEQNDLVLGPACDGGYYLIGMNKLLPAIFTDIAWSGPQVLAQTIDQVPAHTRLALLPPWYDLDTIASCLMARGHIRALRRAGESAVPCRVEVLLNALPEDNRP